jgi:site-specific DNA recombinase
VRAIFAMFETNGSVLLTLQEIERRGWRLKSWTTKAGVYHAGGPFAMNSLRRILGNIIYTGSIQHHGKPYPGEHAAILAPGTWERVQATMATGLAITRGRARNKHLALLNGLLFCETCATRMVYTYVMKNGRKYPYYLCLNAQRKGWAVCPAKSLPAQAIEESVLGRIRERHTGVFEPAEWEQLDRARQVEAMQSTVERIGYDGTARQISIRFQAEAQA